MNAPEPVQSGHVFETLYQELTSLVQELDARRRFDASAEAFLKEYGLVSDFEAFRKRDQ